MKILFDLSLQMSVHVKENQLLNDYCVLDIFKFLHIKDLCSAAQTSLQFQRLAIKTFKKYHRNLDITNKYKIISNDELSELFETFGKYMKKVKINCHCFPYANSFMGNKTLQLIRKNCLNDDQSLESLHLQYFCQVLPQEIRDLYPLFSKLKELTLNQVKLPDSIPHLLGKLTELEEICIANCTPIGFCSIRNVELRTRLKAKRLELRHNEYLNVLEVVSKIDLYFPLLTHLKIHTILRGENYVKRTQFPLTILYVTNLKHLNSLSLDMEFRRVTPLLERLVDNEIPIEALDINYAVFDRDTAELFGKLKDLKNLKLFGNIGVSKTTILDIIRKLPDLERIKSEYGIDIGILLSFIRIAPNIVSASFEMHSKHAFNEGTYAELIEIVKTQSRTQKLTIKIVNYDGQIVTEEEREIIATKTNSEIIKVYRFP